MKRRFYAALIFVTVLASTMGLANADSTSARASLLIEKIQTGTTTEDEEALLQLRKISIPSEFLFLRLKEFLNYSGAQRFSPIDAARDNEHIRQLVENVILNEKSLNKDEELKLVKIAAENSFQSAARALRILSQQAVNSEDAQMKLVSLLSYANSQRSGAEDSLIENSRIRKAVVDILTKNKKSLPERMQTALVNKALFLSYDTSRKALEVLNEHKELRMDLEASLKNLLNYAGSLSKNEVHSGRQNQWIRETAAQILQTKKFVI